MSKEKKVRFRLYLNKKLAQRQEGFYPLYLYINFIGQNTKLSVTDRGKPIYWNEEILKAFNDGVRYGPYGMDFDQLNNKLKTIESVIRYEYSQERDRYSLNGLRERLEWFEQDITDIIEKKAKELFLLENYCIVPEAELDQGQNLFLLHGTREMTVGEYSPSVLIQCYFELHVGFYLYGEPMFNEFSVPSVYGRMLINWLVYEDTIPQFMNFLHDISFAREELMGKLKEVQGLPKYMLEFINRYWPRDERLKSYALLMQESA